MRRMIHATTMAVLLAATALPALTQAGPLSPVAYVNNSAVTQYELDQRVRFLEILRAPDANREAALQALIDTSQGPVTGTVRLKLYKGNVDVVGRKSEDSLFDEKIATFEEDQGAYDQKDAEGFIKLNALRLRIAAGKGRKL